MRPEVIQKLEEEAAEAMKAAYGRGEEQAEEQPETEAQSEAETEAGASEETSDSEVVQSEEMFQDDAEQVAAVDSDQIVQIVNKLLDQRFEQHAARMADRMNAMADTILNRVQQVVDSRIETYASAAPTLDPAKLESMIEPSQEDIDALGPEAASLVASMVRKSLGHVVQAVVHQLAPQIGEVKATVDQSRAAAIQQRVLAELTAAMPDWQEINKREDWKSWLDKPDPISSRRRQDILMEHLTAGRSEPVLNMLRTFRREANIPEPESVSGRQTPGKKPLAAMVSPSRSVSAPVVTSNRGFVPMTKAQYESKSRMFLSQLMQAKDDPARQKAIEAKMAELDRNYMRSLSRR